ncbi:MAG: hypothetical protein K8M05_21685 [Deltaproteobacteria bacterium]|nr:hypothetical protein [Kofleriaceae bacterium]
MRAWLAVLLVVAACADEPFRCPEPRIAIRNPRTLTCEQFHVPSPTCPDEPEPPTWAACGACADLDQVECLETPGCRATYDRCHLLDEPCLGGRVFVGCVGVDRAGPVAGACEGFDAQDCSSRDDCAAWFQHHPTCDQESPPIDMEPLPFFQPQNGTCVLVFSSCLPEPTAPID